MQQLRDHVRDLVRYDVLKETTLEATRYTWQYVAASRRIGTFARSLRNNGPTGKPNDAR